MRALLTHLGPFGLEVELTLCGRFTEVLETRVSNGTRETVLKTTSDHSKVTCKSCLREIKRRLGKK